MTEADIADKYSKGRSMEEAKQIARDIVEGKESCAHMRVAHIKPHPDAPLRSDMKLYLIWDESYETSVKDTVVESLFEVRDDDSKNKSRSGKDGKSKGSKRKISVSDSSDSESESRESESESSSASRRVKKKSGKKAKRRSRGKKEKKEKPIKKKDEDEDQSGPAPVETDKDKKKRMKELDKEKKKAEKEEAKEKKRIEADEKREKTKELNKKRNAVRKAGLILPHVPPVAISTGPALHKVTQRKQSWINSTFGMWFFYTHFITV